MSAVNGKNSSVKSVKAWKYIKFEFGFKLETFHLMLERVKVGNTLQKDLIFVRKADTKC